MYETPQLQRLGSIQSLTLGGGEFSSDALVPNQGCEGGNTGYTCRPSS
jgi:hypothetical protein